MIDVLADAMIEHGIPEYIRSDNGPDFVADVLHKWPASTGSSTLDTDLPAIGQTRGKKSYNAALHTMVQQAV